MIVLKKKKKGGGGGGGGGGGKEAKVDWPAGEMVSCDLSAAPVVFRFIV